MKNFRFSDETYYLWYAAIVYLNFHCKRMVRYFSRIFAVLTTVTNNWYFVPFCNYFITNKRINHVIRCDCTLKCFDQYW